MRGNIKMEGNIDVNKLPFKVESGKPVWKFEVLENGDVLMCETMNNKVWFHSRDFLSFYRVHLKDKEVLENSLSEESVKRVREDIKVLDETMDELKPLVEDSEGKTKVAYEKLMFDNRVAALKDEFGKGSDRKAGYMEGIWANFNQDDKVKALDLLPDDVRNFLVKLKVAEKVKERKTK